MRLAKVPRGGSYFKKNEELLGRLSRGETLLGMPPSPVSERKEFKRGGWKGKQDSGSIESYTQGGFK